MNLTAIESFHLEANFKLEASSSLLFTLYHKHDELN